ncbi:MAG: 2,3-bisphosphoglycerate-dependent phosphoglycerate mutase [Verrucomicrobia bacterium]|nr:2,3-bisphosphoglycerate-dependent phosphoglycerate mutase [Verrucomicrobiota bacterium]
MAKLILLRHGASLWNELNIFTGWVDIPLSQKGIQESLDAGKKIADIPIDVIFTSTLCRAQQTAMLAMSVHKGGRIPRVLHSSGGNLEKWGQIYSKETEGQTIPVYVAWELNERMYGELQGMNKDDMRTKFGAEQVHVWRRSFDVAPPQGESLKMTAQRAIPYFEKEIIPELKKGKNVLVSAHGNSLRAIVKDIDGLSDEAVVKLEIPTGVPIIYTFDKGKWVKDV